MPNFLSPPWTSHLDMVQSLEDTFGPPNLLTHWNLTRKGSMNCSELGAWICFFFTNVNFSWHAAAHYSLSFSKTISWDKCWICKWWKPRNCSHLHLICHHTTILLKHLLSLLPSYLLGDQPKGLQTGKMSLRLVDRNDSVLCGERSKKTKNSSVRG